SGGNLTAPEIALPPPERHSPSKKQAHAVSRQKIPPLFKEAPVTFVALSRSVQRFIRALTGSGQASDTRTIPPRATVEQVEVPRLTPLTWDYSDQYPDIVTEG